MVDYFTGIDPGKKGGISVLDPDGKIFCSYEMPLTEKKEIDIFKIYKLWPMAADSFCLIEKSQAMPRQGVVSTFNYGKEYGQIIAILIIMKIPFKEIRPQTWKKEFNLNNKKLDSLAVASELFPDQNFFTDRMRLMDGKAESLLIAEYARRKYGKC